MLPDSAAPWTAPAAAPAAALVRTERTTSFALARMPLGACLLAGRFVVVFLLVTLLLLAPDLRAVNFWLEALVVLFFAAREDVAFFAVDFFAVDFLEPLDVDFLEPDCLRAFFAAMVLLLSLSDSLRELNSSGVDCFEIGHSSILNTSERVSEVHRWLRSNASPLLEKRCLLCPQFAANLKKSDQLTDPPDRFR